MSQWVSGFSHIIREETDPQTKNFMLDYLSDIMDDSQDFGWPSAKGAHAVLLCQMEQDKIQWHETSKIDRVRRAHAKKISQNPHQNKKRPNKPMPCKYYQKGTCGQSNDHEHNGQLYLHACSTCFSSGKTYPHPSRECRRAKERVRHCNAVPKIYENHHTKITVGRTVVNTNALLPSKNWKHDWWRFKNMSFAQVVKKNCTHKVPDCSEKKFSNDSQSSLSTALKVRQYYNHSRKTPNVTRKPHGDTKHVDIVKNCKPLGNKKPIVKHNNDTKPISAKPFNQYSVDNNKWFSKNRFAPLNDIIPRSHCNNQEVSRTKQTDGNGQKSEDKGHKVGGVRGKRHTVIDSVSKPQVTKSPVTNSLGLDNKTHIQDKYDLDLRFHSRHRQKVATAKNCEIFKLWDLQNKDKFGFIPLQDQLLPQEDIPAVKNQSILQDHAEVAKSGTYNFMKAQIPVQSQLNVDSWEKHLQQYWDRQLVFLIKYGFPLHVDPAITLNHEINNHKSAIDHPQDIQAYLDEEIKYHAILGPFKDSPIKNLHVSPLMTRDKPGSQHRRVIVDLSYPQNHSVNAGVEGNAYLTSEFLLTLPSVDHITDQIKKLGKGSKIFKIDISRAFRHVKLDPACYNLTGIYHNSYFIDTCLAFGYRNGSAIFQRLTDAIRYIMRTKGHTVTNYIDDVIGYGLNSTVDHSFQELYSLLQDLGLNISEHKLVYPTTKVICLGVEIDTEKFIISVPPQKLEEIRVACQDWLTKTYCSKRELQSLLGRLLYITKCVRASRFFLNRMFTTLRSAHKLETIHLDTEFHRDVKWFAKLAHTFNGTAFFKHEKIQGDIELDASLQGLGAKCGKFVYAISIPRGYENYNIVHLEMLNILVALRTWGLQWKGKALTIHCDNQAVVSILNTGYTRDLTLAAIARNIFMLTAQLNLDIVTLHILGKRNIVADILSRLQEGPHQLQKLAQVMPEHIWVRPPNTVLIVDWSI